MNVRTLCLGVLSFQDATGYEIKKMVEEGMFNHFIEASYGSIYPALTRMSEEGLVTCREEAQDGRPDKKVYSITEYGRTELISALCGPPREDKFKSEFLFVMLLANLLPEHHIASVYGQRIDELRAELQQMRGCADSGSHPGGQFVVGYGIAIVEAALNYLEANKDYAAQTETDAPAHLSQAAGAAE
jgi:DNA-binding PadR family transcriptional regulator